MVKMLDDNLKTLGMIYKITVLEKEHLWFSKLVELLDGDVEKSKVSIALDRLYDLGIINVGYEKVDDRWTNTIRLEDEARLFAASMCEKMMKDE